MADHIAKQIDANIIEYLKALNKEGRKTKSNGKTKLSIENELGEG